MYRRIYMIFSCDFKCLLVFALKLQQIAQSLVRCPFRVAATDLDLDLVCFAILHTSIWKYILIYTYVFTFQHCYTETYLNKTGNLVFTLGCREQEVIL